MAATRSSKAGKHVLDVGALRSTVESALENSTYLHDKLRAAGVKPSTVAEPEDLVLLPFTVKSELRDTPMADYAAVPPDRIVRVHASSGTTGRRTICAYTADDLDDWANMVARCLRFAGLTARDRVQLAVGYGLWTAGSGFQAGVERLGAMAVPTGPGRTEVQLELMRELRSTALCATASYALLLAEFAANHDPHSTRELRVVITGSERWSEKTRSRIESLLDVETFDIYGLTELWGPGAGIECGFHDGIHVWSDHYHVEIIDPETLEPVPPGEVGEIVVTTLHKQATPLIRYRTGDLSRMHTGSCPCGSGHPRIGRILGRTDDQLKVRGVIFLPVQVDVVLGELPGVGPEFQVHVDRDREGRESLTVVAEAIPAPGLEEQLAERLHAKIGLRVGARLVEPGSLPRSERKTKRVFDHRSE